MSSAEFGGVEGTGAGGDGDVDYVVEVVMESSVVLFDGVAVDY
jgi:hypothetical protein